MCQPNFSWAGAYLNNNNVGTGYAITSDNNGNVFSAGIFDNTLDFDSGIGTYYMSGLGGSFDVYLTRFSQYGGFIWAKSFGGTSYETVNSIVLDASSNIYICGTFTGTTDFDPGAAVFNLYSPNVASYVAKFDNSGNFIWARQFSGNNLVVANELCIDAIGNLLFVGRFNGTADFDPGPSTYTLTSNGQSDLFVCKISSSGNFVWAKGMGSNLADDANAVVTDKFSNVFFTGSFMSICDFDPGPGTTTLAPIGNIDIFVVKLNTSGNLIWARNFGDPFGGNGYPKAITIDSVGNVLSTGRYSGAFDFDPGPATSTVTMFGGSGNVYISKLSAIGDYRWVVAYNSIGPNVGETIKADEQGNVYTAGEFYGTPDFNPGSATFTLASTPGGYNDLFYSKLDSAGNHVWAIKIGGGGDERVNDIFLDASNAIYSTGSFSSTVDFNPGVIQYNLTSPYERQPFIYKLCQPPDKPKSISGNTIVCDGSQNNYTIQAVPQATSYVWTLPGAWFGTSTQTAIQATAGLGSGIISVSAINSCGASNTATVNVQVSAYPTITINSDSICAGENFTLVPSGATSYTFFNGTPIVTPTITSTYSVIGSNLPGCLSTNTAVSTIFVNVLPIVTAQSGSICSGNAFTINPTGAANYSITGGSYIVSPSVTTTYTIVGASAEGCISNPAFSVTVSVFAYPLPNISLANGTVCAFHGYTLNPTGATTYTFLGAGPVIAPNSTMTYSVIGTNNLGCSSNSITTAVVSVFLPPVITAPNATICMGDSYTISPLGASNYTFSGGTPIVSPLSSSNYTVFGANNDGCISDPIYVFVNVVPLPNVAISSLFDTICKGDLVELFATGASSYTWSTGATTYSIASNPLQTSTYTVIGLSSSGCSNTVNFTQFVTTCNTINEQLSAVILNAYPNPSSDYVNLNLPFEDLDRVEIFDLDGNCIYSSAISGTQIEIYVEDFLPGLYFLKVIGGGRVKAIAKIVLQ